MKEKEKKIAFIWISAFFPLVVCLNVCIFANRTKDVF